MDPWGGNTSEGTSSSQENIFDDSFTIEAEKSDGSENGKFQKLPDSEEYLAVLETKLKNLKKKKVSNKEEIVGELLLRSNSRLEISDTDIELDSAALQAAANNQLVRQILPKQPISRGETVRLLQADYLGQGYTKSLQEDTSLSD